MSNVSRGFAYEREVKQHFTDAGWGCTRAAHSASAMDLIAFIPYMCYRPPCGQVFLDNGYEPLISKSQKIPLFNLARKIEKKYIKHVYWDVAFSERWVVILMQCKIRKR